MSYFSSYYLCLMETKGVGSKGAAEDQAPNRKNTGFDCPANAVSCFAVHVQTLQSLKFFF